MNGGAFALLTSLQAQGQSGDSLTDLGGLSQRHPVHAAFFVVLLLSLAGIPPTAGFIGKYFIFAALLQTGHTALAIVASIFAVVGLYFYFRLVREMYGAGNASSPSGFPVSMGIRLALGATAVLTLLIGLFPEAILRNTALVTGIVP
jgi:NADH-quinone oxidoreductase subunit N